MGSYINMKSGYERFTFGELVDRIFIRPCDLDKTFEFYFDNRGGEVDKVTRVYLFEEEFLGEGLLFMLSDFKKTACYDPSLPSYDDFWKSTDYVTFSIHVNQEDCDNVTIWDIKRYIYRAINERSQNGSGS